MRILVVEDDRLLNNTLCYNLYTAGYVVDSVLTKSAASNFLTKQDYDLIVLDVNLPDGNGFDFCREVKERRPDTAVIFLTANDMESDMLKGYELGAEDYVTKPFPMSVFQKKLSVVLGRLAKQSGGGDCYEDTPTLGMTQKNQPKIKYTLDFDVTPHQLRHTYITNLLYAGVDPKTVQYVTVNEVNSNQKFDLIRKSILSILQTKNAYDIMPIGKEIISPCGQKSESPRSCSFLGFLLIYYSG